MAHTRRTRWKRVLQKGIIKTAEAVLSRQAVRHRGRCVIVGAPVPEQNRGDQAMLDVAVAEARAAGFQELVVVSTGLDAPTHLNPRDGIYLQNLHHFFWQEEAFAPEMRLMSVMGRASNVLVCGADILDETYGETITRRFLQCAQLAGRLNVPARILGFSVSRPPAGALRQRFLDLGPNVRLFARDPVSWRRLREAGIDRAELAADTAFLLCPSGAEQLQPELRELLMARNRHIALVALHDGFFEASPSPSDAVSVMASALNILARERGVDYVLMPHGTGDVLWLSRLRDALASLGRQVMLTDGLPVAQEVKQVASMSRHVFTSRMHVAIAGLGSGVPVTSFVYRGKFEGLYEHFGLTAGLLPQVDAARTDVSLASILRERLDDSPKEAAAIAQRLPAVMQLAKANFSGLA